MPGLRPDDIGLLVSAGDVAISPDGTWAVYTLTTVDLAANAYRTRLWLVSTEGGRPRPLTGGDRAILPCWSPDGAVLAWVAAREEGTAICALAVNGPGEPAVVCTWPDDISELAWAPTGDRLAFVGRTRDVARYGPPGEATRASAMPPRRVTRLQARLDGDGWIFDRPTHVHVVPLDGSSPPQALTSGEAPAAGISWAPNGTRLAYVSATHDTWDLDGRRDLWLVDSGGGPARRLTDTTTAAWSCPSWSPDGTRLAALVDPTPLAGPRHGQLWVHDVARRRSARWASGLDRNLAPYGATRTPVWSEGEVLVTADDGGRVHLYAAGDPAASGDMPRLVVGGVRQIRSFDAAAGRLAVVASSVVEAGEVWVGELAGGGLRQVSHHGTPLLTRRELVRPERFTATSADGTEVECWALRPVGAVDGRKYPTVVNIHGGPFSQYGETFFDEFQLQVGAGLGVVACNPRGSSGYSEAWGRAIRWPEAPVDPGSGWGGVDYEDVMACAEEAVSRFAWVDPGRLGVHGGSYGGYLTSWIVGHTDRFKAAVSERAVNNLVTMEHNSDISGFFKEQVGWSHLQRPDLYARQSPSTFVSDMTTPMLLVHSEDDLRCPISQAEELFVALRLLGRNPQLVRFPGEGHELSRSGSPRHRIMRAEIILEWWAEQL